MSTLWQRSPRPTRWSMSLAVVAVLCVAGARLAADEYLPAIGNTPGRGQAAQFVALCPTDQTLVGVELRVGEDVDAIRPLCALAFGPTSVGQPVLTNGSGLVAARTLPGGGLGAAVAPGWYGGTGGGIIRLQCPSNTPVVIGMDVVAEYPLVRNAVNSVHLFCGAAVRVGQPVPKNPSAIFDGRMNHDVSMVPHGSLRCSFGQLAMGVHGFIGFTDQYVQKLGLVCAPPRLVLDNRPVVARVDTTGTAPPSGSAVPICERAAQARARNSPAAAQLERMCRDANTVGSVGRTDTAPPSGPPPAVCDQAADARDRKSPAAAALAEKCRSVGGQVPPAGGANLEALAARGAAVAAEDPLFSQLREAQPEGPMRRGFDIAAGASAGQTAWGPSKQAILDSLPAVQQEGFKVAISYALDRNRYAARADIGAVIAAADADVEQGRQREADARYQLGFDIASGIFGDPGLGAQGNKSLGPGSLGIRDSLSVPAKRGFDASVKLHLSRTY